MIRAYGEFTFAPANYLYTFYDAIQNAIDWYEGEGVTCEFGYAYDSENGFRFEPALFTLNF